MHKVILLIPTLIFISCASYSNFNTPVILDTGGSLAGVGISVIRETDSVIPELYYRRNIFSKTDFGVKLSGLPFLAGLAHIDIKRSIIQSNQFAISGGLGFSHEAFNGDPFNYTANSFIPDLYIGNERLYVALKYYQMNIDGNIDLLGGVNMTGKHNLSSFTMGTTIGNHLRLQPEVTVMTPKGYDPSFLFSIGITAYEKK